MKRNNRKRKEPKNRKKQKEKLEKYPIFLNTLSSVKF
jgi:hypothetical protein